MQNHLIKMFMDMDFTQDIYKKLVASLKAAGYTFQPFSEYLRSRAKKVVVLRHDVDRLPKNSLKFAQIQSKMGIRGSYYFRAVPQSWNENVIREIVSLGHEVGYHYENLTTVASRLNGTLRKKSSDILLEEGIRDFELNLIRLRKMAPVETICMHGSPMSPYDSKDLWKKYDYSDYGIIGEPYFDIDFREVFYLTDTGRRWDGYNVSVRDKIPEYQNQWIRRGLVYHSTNDIIRAVENRQLPRKIMMTFHPQRWHNRLHNWAFEYCWQGLKNQYKRRLVRKQKS